MYLLALTLGMCFSYFILLYLFFAFFKNEQPLFRRESLYSVVLIAFFSILTFIASVIIPDRQLANRFLHAIGGGFLSFLICFLVVRDSKLRLSRFQFFIFSALVVTAMGVANEVLEFFLQNYFHFTFSKTINDTWLDLLSNSVGILIAALLFTPFVGRKKGSDSARQR